MSVERGSPMTQAQMDALAGLANSRIGFDPPIAFDGSNWYSELNRMRSGVISGKIVPDFRNPAFACSGPWLLLGDGITYQKLIAYSALPFFDNTTSPQYRPLNWYTDLLFYFRASQSAKVYTVAQADGYGLPYTLLANLDQTNASENVLTGTFKFVVTGGGTFKMGRVDISIGSPDPGDTMTGTSTVPGATFHSTAGGPHYFTVPDGSIGEGEFQFKVTLSPGGADETVGTANVAAIDPLPIHVSAASPTISVWAVSSAAEDAPEGICKAESIKKITVADLPAGLQIQIYARLVDPDTDDITYALRDGATVGFVASSSELDSDAVPGIWVGKQWPIPAVVVQDDINHGFGHTTKYYPGGAHYMQLPAPDPALPKIGTVDPAIGYRPPRYPSFRDTDDIPTGGQWDIWQPAGRQILSWSARRFPTGSNKLPSPAPAPITVNIGYMRDDEFVQIAAATIDTGEVSTGTQYVTWPIFDNTPLAYQCAEAVFVAVTAGIPILASLGGDETVPPMIDPILAAHYNDLEAVLNI